VPNTAQVALEAGNSPQMIFGHYRELVRAADAEKWFGITAEAAEAVKEARKNGAAAEIVALPVAA
jgi:phage tail sheath gpL-like